MHTLKNDFLIKLPFDKASLSLSMYSADLVAFGAFVALAVFGALAAGLAGFFFGLGAGLKDPSLSLSSPTSSSEMSLDISAGCDMATSSSRS